VASEDRWTEESFASILTAAQAGARWAFERLYNTLAPAVVGYLRVQGAQEPEDLTSEVFERVFTNLHRFEGSEAQFRSWVFTIAHHRLVDDRRRVLRQPLPDFQLTPQGFDGGIGGDVEDEALRRVATARVRRLCDRLMPDQRDVILLRLFGDLTIEATADLLRKSPGAVKALQHRAVMSLRRLVEREGVTF
jgi:RNA polymerase sigma-70 factor (ECF subfamily)